MGGNYLTLTCVLRNTLPQQPRERFFDWLMSLADSLRCAKREDDRHTQPTWPIVLIGIYNALLIAFPHISTALTSTASNGAIYALFLLTIQRTRIALTLHN